MTANTLLPLDVDTLIDFAESGNMHRIYTVTNQFFEGWIMEITDDALLISCGFSETKGVDTWLPISEIDRTRLAFFDPEEQLWQNFDVNA